MTRERFHRLYQLLGSRICKARLTASLSQTVLARRVGVNRVSIVNIEKGRQRPGLDILWRIADALQIELADLVPRKKDFDAVDDGVKLDEKTVAEIQAATRGDPNAALRLEEFIRMAQHRTRENR